MFVFSIFKSFLLLLDLNSANRESADLKVLENVRNKLNYEKNSFISRKRFWVKKIWKEKKNIEFLVSLFQEKPKLSYSSKLNEQLMYFRSAL